ncbi:MAG: adenylate/guanylate cyclase domain-containing protein [Bacteroidota bacterium]
MEKQNRKLQAILFAGIAGYTALMQEDEATARQLLDKFHFAINTQVDSNQGKVIHNYGDGCVCTFDSAVAAVQCAKELQEEFQTLPKVPVRIGLHSGDVFFQQGNVYGDSVNIASRIESMGVPGAVLFSKKIERHIANQPGLKIESIGKFAFKNVEEEMEIFALANDWDIKII